MRLYVQAGITTLDCADIYTGVEELIGQFLHRYRDAMKNGSLPSVQVHTKCVPDLDSLPSLSRQDIEAIVDRSLQRLGVEQLDLVQFHWWDYSVPGYVEALGHLQAFQKAGKIGEIGVTNFDAAHLEEVLQAGISVVSNQVQYSALDHRPERDMVSLCQRSGISLLCYGTLGGGLLSSRYLGVPEPQPPYENRSLLKYKLIVDDFGGWDLFQQLLTTLQEIGQKHDVSIASVASRYILQKSSVGAVIIGTRHVRHLRETMRLIDLELDEHDLGAIARVVQQARGPEGGVYSVERLSQKHAAIMKYNLNRKE
jgi:aryl-alcohol dehydrogenase-like predicted oxidoreductase